MNSAIRPKLETVDLCKVFLRRNGDALLVFKDINLQVYPGEFVSMVGASGCGKTTFLRILDGLMEPTYGRVLLDGEPVQGPGPDRGFVFQMDALWPWRTVEGNIIFGLEVQGRPRREASEVVKRLVSLVGLKGFESHLPHELSGGMRQRVNLARALALDPEVLLMDEPFASLDAQTREVMQVELINIWTRHKKTVVFVTHQIDEAVFLADRVVVLSSRPGTIKEVIPIDIPRPRALDAKRTPEFLAYVSTIWQMIEAQVLQGILEKVER